MSSVISQIPFLSQNSTSFETSASGKTAPEGLFGLFRRIALVEEETARSISENCGTKLPSSGVTTTGTPCTIFTISG